MQLRCLSWHPVADHLSTGDFPLALINAKTKIPFKVSLNCSVQMHFTVGFYPTVASCGKYLQANLLPGHELFKSAVLFGISVCQKSERQGHNTSEPVSLFSAVETSFIFEAKLGLLCSGNTCPFTRLDFVV